MEKYCEYVTKIPRDDIKCIENLLQEGVEFYTIIQEGYHSGCGCCNPEEYLFCMLIEEEKIKLLKQWLEKNDPSWDTEDEESGFIEYPIDEETKSNIAEEAPQVLKEIIRRGL
jgi:hypothetical protein